jgi:hypothetical protein
LQILLNFSNFYGSKNYKNEFITFRVIDLIKETKILLCCGLLKIAAIVKEQIQNIYLIKNAQKTCYLPV